MIPKTEGEAENSSVHLRWIVKRRNKWVHSGRAGSNWRQSRLQPSIKGPIADPFDRKEDSHGDDFTGLQVCQVIFGNSRYGLIPIEQFADKVFRCYALSSLRCKGVATRSLKPSHDPFQGPLKLAPSVSRRMGGPLLLEIDGACNMGGQLTSP